MAVAGARLTVRRPPRMGNRRLRDKGLGRVGSRLCYQFL